MKEKQGGIDGNTEESVWVVRVWGRLRATLWLTVCSLNVCCCFCFVFSLPTRGLNTLNQYGSATGAHTSLAS